LPSPRKPYVNFVFRFDAHFKAFRRQQTIIFNLELVLRRTVRLSLPLLKDPWNFYSPEIKSAVYTSFVFSTKPNSPV
jgi:hypothetical protein